MKPGIPSPLYYNGNKYTLLDGLDQFIPKNQNGTFHDVFGGSGTMSLNFARYFKKAIYYEPTYTYDLFVWALSMTQDKVDALENEILDIDKKYKMICNGPSNRERERIITEQGSNTLPEYQGWIKGLEDYNVGINSDAKTLYIASLFAFSNTLKISRKTGKLDKSWGAYNFTPFGLKDFYQANKQSARIESIKQGFKDFDFSKVDKENDFVYLDPPYLGTQANYNKHGTDEQDDEMLAFCERLNAAGIKGGMSNIFENKGFVNVKLKNGCYSNKWIVHSKDKKYTLNGVTGAAIEVFITNQDWDESKNKINIFDLI